MAAFVLMILIYQMGSIILQFILELLLYPLDTWKTRLQYKSIYGAANANGFLHFYRGFCITVLLTTPIISTANHFALLMTIMLCLAPSNFAVYLILVLISFAISSTLFTFREVLKVTQQVNKTSVSFITIMKDSYRKDGLYRGTFRGYWISFAVMSIDICQNYLAVDLLSKFTLGRYHIIIEVCLMLIALAVLTPLDLAKTAIQLHDNTATDIEKADNVHYERLNILSCVTEENRNNPFKILFSVYKERGFVGIYAGLTPIAIRIVSIFMLFKALTLIGFY